jgi:Fe-S-cluster-containing hydrogenase component 2
MHCEDPICLDMCLMGAISRENESTIVLNSEACRGCKACMMACPYGAIRFFGGRMIKCDLCHGKALCAEWCPTQALRLIKDESTEAARSKKMIGMMMKSITESR